MGGYKHDDGKVRMDLLPPEFLFGTAEVLTHGLSKYPAYNWAEGMSWSRVFSALMRHMWKWWKGETLDKDSGLPHLHHAACCIAFLIAYEQRNIVGDDRPNSPSNPIEGHTTITFIKDKKYWYDLVNGESNDS